MSNLHRRLKKLEALPTDDAGLVPGSEQWLAYWIERADKILNGDDEVKDCKIPLEVVDAILETVRSRRRMPSDNHISGHA
jgi:hypothetical protein